MKVIVRRLLRSIGVLAAVRWGRLRVGGLRDAVLDGFKARWVRFRARSVLAADDGLRVVRHRPSYTIGRIDPRPTAAAVRQQNRAMVIEALDDAGISWLALPVSSPHRYRVAVHGDDRGPVLAALRKEASHERHLLADTKPGKIRRLVKLRRATHAFRRTSVWRCFNLVTDPTGQLVIGHLAGCEIEFWELDQEEDMARLRASRWNGLLMVAHDDSLPPPHPLSDVLPLNEVDFPIDVVITWVDGQDPEWIGAKNSALTELGRAPSSDAAADSRFVPYDELRYCLRSIETFAAFVDKIYVVTAGQRPAWLVEDDRLRVVDHQEIFPASALPTFNSHSIEASLHKIDGLAEHFIYMNDDFMFGRAVPAELFFRSSGLSLFYQSTALIDPYAPLSVDAAARNSQALVHSAFGRRAGQKFKHAPYALRRSVLEEIAERFADEIDRTVHAVFRSETDIPVPSSFHHYYGYLTGRAVPGALKARYIDVADSNFAAKRRSLLRRDYDTLCVNDGGADAGDDERRDQVRELLQWLQPVASRWESSNESRSTVP